MNISGVGFSRVEADVRITDFSISDTTNGSISMYESFGKDFISSEVSLKSNSSITYNLEITNYGTVDVGIFDITGLPDEVNYSIKDYNLSDKICDDSGKCNSFIKRTYELTLTVASTYSGCIQMNFDFRTYHKVTYTDIDNKGYPTEVIDGGNLSITFNEKLENVSVLVNDVEVVHYNKISSGQTIVISNISDDIEIIAEKLPPVVLVSGEISKIGGEVCIKDECFYIITNDGTKVTMFAKMNITTDDIPMQNSSAPTVAFSLSAYWGSVSKGTYVYNSNSLVFTHVENYKTYLSNYGVNILDARLINKSELDLLGCSGNSCKSAAAWVYATSYWTGAANSSSSMLRVADDMTFGYNSFSYDTRFGIRPVITINVDDIYIPSDDEIVNNDLDTVGSVIEIGGEHFYIISSDEDCVTMLAKYNLFVGYYVDDWEMTPLENPTGIQDNRAVASKWTPEYDARDFPWYGTTIFSETDYWTGSVSSYPVYVYNSNSLVYDYVEDYKKYIEGYGLTVDEARFITLEELETLGCSVAERSCHEAPSWVYATSYWTGDAFDSTYVWCVDSGGSVDGYTFNFGDVIGVRPVIKIAKEEIRAIIDINN